MRLARKSLVVTTVLVLSGCIDLDVDLKLDSSAKASGTYEVTIAKSVASFLGVTRAEDLEKALLEDEKIKFPKGESVSVRDVGLSYLMTVKLKDLALEDNDLKTEVLANGNIRFQYINEGSVASDEEFDLGTEPGKISFRIEFPGNIVETGPNMVKVSERVATLNSDISESINTFVVSEPSIKKATASLVPVVAGLAALIAISVGIGITRARRKKLNTSESVAGQI